MRHRSFRPQRTGGGETFGAMFAPQTQAEGAIAEETERFAGENGGVFFVTAESSNVSKIGFKK